MNVENFTSFLKNPSRLYQLPYQELKSLVLQYPYCQNLQVLLLLKGQIDQHKDLKAQLHKTATYSVDRQHLFHILKDFLPEPKTTESVLPTEEYLELRELSRVNEVYEPAPLNGINDYINGLNSDHLDLSEKPNSFKEEPEPAPESNYAALPEQEDFQLEDLIRKIDKEQEELQEDLSTKSSFLLPELPLDISTLILEEDQAQQEVEDFFEEIYQEEATDDNLETDRSTDTSEPTLNIEPDPSISPKEQPTGSKETESKPNHFLTEQSNGTKPEKVFTPTHQLNLSFSKRSGSIPSASIQSHMRKNEGTTPSPTPKSSFTSWVQQFQTPQIQLKLSELMEAKRQEELREQKVKRKPFTPLKKVKRPIRNFPTTENEQVANIVRESIQENEEIFSETLAQLLEYQGQYLKAINMYERLMHLHPEKSREFLTKIENLKTYLP